MERSRILVVDDDPLIRGSLYEMLKGRQYDVEMAADGTEAMDHLKRRPFQLVLTDWKMPQVDGMSLIGHIRSQYPDVSVVLITGFGTINSAVEAIKRGAFDYLTKPIQPEELEATIQRALSQYAPATEGEDVNDPRRLVFSWLTSLSASSSLSEKDCKSICQNGIEVQPSSVKI